MNSRNLQISSFATANKKDVVGLFLNVFSASESEQEGKSVAQLVSNLIEKTPPSDLFGFVAFINQEIVGSIFLSRIKTQDNRNIFILSPVAIKTTHQGKGIGQQLIQYGLTHLKVKGVEIVLTYGDPAFYSKIGFNQISTDEIIPPHELSQPIGWLARSLTEDALPRIKGKVECVKALDEAEYW